MKRMVIVAAVALGAAILYHHTTASDPVKVYEKFAEEVLRRHYAAAAEMSSGLTATELERLGSQERIGGGPPMFQTLFSSQFRIDSVERAGDRATVVAVQTVLFNPVGVESAVRPAMYAELRQVAGLRKSSSGWKVATFQNEFIKMDELPRR